MHLVFQCEVATCGYALVMPLWIALFLLDPSL
jgi:hypothetical protein